MTTSTSTAKAKAAARAVKIMRGFWFLITSLSSLAIIVLAVVLFINMMHARTEIAQIHFEVSGMKADLAAIRVVYDTIGARIMEQNREREEARNEPR